ncbi:MAG: hypothetical protein RI988_2967 [Pseudomonadota bacterium]
MKQYVVYTRVSTEDQGRSGLGLDAQLRDISIFLDGFSEVPFEVLAEFRDIQTGRDDDRPELGSAIALAKRTGAELLVAKLDRFSRDVAFIATMLKEKRFTLRVASMPYADTFQLHIYAALAEQERKFISMRTKAALGEAKARGVKLGGLRDATMKRNLHVKTFALERAKRVENVIVPLRQGGATLQAIADALNAASVPTARGGQWHPAQVQRTLERLEGTE